MEDKKQDLVEKVDSPNKTQEPKVSSDQQRAPRTRRPQQGQGNPNYSPRPGRGRNQRFRRPIEKEFEERVVNINRVSKTVKGGRRLRFSALVVVGDMKGRYGFANAKALEVPDAIKKALDNAKANLHNVNIVKNDTIAHEVIGKFGACEVFLKPAPDGTGIIAGGPVRAVLELAGIKNVYSKVYGSRAPIKIIRATNKGLRCLLSDEKVKRLRGK